jgi:AmiR/NasT family two-component response regulator
MIGGDARRSSVQRNGWPFPCRAKKEADLRLAIELAIARFEEWQALEQEAADLKEALATREVVGRAKEVLMQRDGLTEQEAFLDIQRRGRNGRMPMREVAEAILSGRYG